MLDSSNKIFDLKDIIGQFDLAPGMQVADFGTGSGFFTVEMAKLVAEKGLVSAIDILDPALETVKIKALSEGLKNIQLIKANLEAAGGTGLTDDSQDFVLIKNVLFQNDQKLEIIKEAKRVLKPSGRLVIIDWAKGAGGLGPPDEYRSSKENILELANQTGLNFQKDITIDVYHFGMMLKK